MHTVMASVVAALLLLVLVWQLRSRRLGWQWRWLWLPVTAGFWFAFAPPQAMFRQAELVVLTPGDASTESAALQWAKQHDAALLRADTTPDFAVLQQLQQQLAGEGGKLLRLFGHGFSAPVWQHLPAQTVIWQGAEPPIWQLQATDQLMLGDSLSIRLRAPATAQRLQLLDGRQQVVADAPFAAGMAELRYQPPAAGHYDWTLRVLNSDNAVAREIALAFAVQQRPSMLIDARFAAPSFEQRALREWWQQTGQRAEIVSRTGQSVQRRDLINVDDPVAAKARVGDGTAGRESPSIDASSLQPEQRLLVRDLRSWLNASAKQRADWLQQVASGAGLLLLADGSEAEMRNRQQLARQLDIDWHSLSETEQSFALAEVSLQRAVWQPQVSAHWRLGNDAGVWQRDWQQGRIIWLGVLNSHRLWQRARGVYAEWWQQALQLAQPPQPRWISPGVVLQRQPSLLCLAEIGVADIGLAAAGANLPLLQLQTPSGEVQSLRLLSSSWPDRACAAYTPSESGWYQLRAPIRASWRVYAEPPLIEQQWHAAQAATRQHSQSQEHAERHTRQPLPRWPFLLLVLIGLGLIWWRERLQSVS